MTLNRAFNRFLNISDFPKQWHNYDSVIAPNMGHWNPCNCGSKSQAHNK